MALVLNNPCGLSNPKAILIYKEVYIFSKGISPKVDIITQLQFKLAYYIIAVQHISHYAMETPPSQ